MLMKLEESRTDILGFMASGRLTDNDYKNFLIPQVKGAIEREGRIRLLFRMDGFRGWDIQAAWDDLSFGIEINPQVDKIAIVGDRKWERWVARLLGPFAHGEIRYFDVAELQAAWSWIRA
ncbi:STAS/SEC14 domain-containing protein [Motiliproteus sp. SC1-56]|uniref:STAS/SEC14 domain-containing protein n=1 Tax=Motiliproteus sp. SC1-56 TaxID=2799565 RepID=UPI001A8E3D88|nr:STAS/SEC14 domain-containing protein [Motiliproteus sp. SC1-56]